MIDSFYVDFWITVREFEFSVLQWIISFMSCDRCCVNSVNMYSAVLFLLCLIFWDIYDAQLKIDSRLRSFQMFEGEVIWQSWLVPHWAYHKTACFNWARCNLKTGVNQLARKINAKYQSLQYFLQRNLYEVQIMIPVYSYSEALQFLNLGTLDERRSELC